LADETALLSRRYDHVGNSEPFGSILFFRLEYIRNFKTYPVVTAKLNSDKKLLNVFVKVNTCFMHYCVLYLLQILTNGAKSLDDVMNLGIHRAKCCSNIGLEYFKLKIPSLFYYGMWGSRQISYRWFIDWLICSFIHF
jgi:hypothetical protein